MEAPEAKRISERISKRFDNQVFVRSMLISAKSFALCREVLGAKSFRLLGFILFFLISSVSITGPDFFRSTSLLASTVSAKACDPVLKKIGASEAESSAESLSLSNAPWITGERAPRGFWGNPENQKAYMKWLGERLGYKEPKDWYQVTKDLIQDNRGSGLLPKFNNSPAAIVKALVDAPEGGWRPWLFGKVPRNYWENLDNQKEYITWLWEQLGYKEPEDWYGLTEDLIQENSGRGLPDKLNGSPADMVMEILKDQAPEGGWRPWLFGKAPNGFWENPDNQKAYITWLGEQLGFTKPEDWYKLTNDLIKENSGSGLLDKFRGSPLEIVKALVDAPEGGWKPWLFGKVPGNYWDNPDNQKEYITWLWERLGYKEPKDWYKLTKDLIQKNSGSTLLQKFNSSPAEMVMEILKDQAPEGGWEKDKFYDSSKNETRMREILTGWFKDLNFNITNNDRKTHGLTFEESGHPMEADVLIEELKFAIEYHGIQHYKPVESWGGQSVFERIQERDQEKRETFKNAGYIFIEIPFDKWTDGSPETLKILILEQLAPYEKHEDSEVRGRAWFIREALDASDASKTEVKDEGNVDVTISAFGESDSLGSEGSESDAAASSTAASGGR